MDNFLNGFLAPARALGIVFKNKKLIKYFIIPVVINTIVLFLFLFFGGGWVISQIGDFFNSKDSWLWQALFYVIATLVTTTLVIVFFFVYSAVCNIIGAPFYDLLSEKTEKILNKSVEEEKFSFKTFLYDTFRTIKEEINKFLFFDVSQLLLLFLNLIPLIGSIVYAILSLVISWWLFAYQYLEIPLGRRRMSFKGKRFFVNQNKFRTLGFGLAVMLGTLIPVFNIVYIPLCVCAGTLLFHELEK